MSDTRTKKRKLVARHDTRSVAVTPYGTRGDVLPTQHQAMSGRMVWSWTINHPMIVTGYRVRWAGWKALIPIDATPLNDGDSLQIVIPLHTLK